MSVKAMELPPGLVFLDIETQQVRSDPAEQRVSIAVTYNSSTGGYHYYDEHSIGGLFSELAQAKLVIGFNIRQFDYKVLEKYAPKGFDFQAIPTFDIFEVIYRETGLWVALADVARAYGLAKTGTGLEAVKWWREGMIKELQEYCRNDVAIVKHVYECYRKSGYIYYMRGGKIYTINPRSG